MDQKELNVLMSETVLQRGWKDFTEKRLTHWLFWFTEVFIGGAISLMFGAAEALLFILAVCLAVIIAAIATAPARQRDELRRAFNVAAPIYHAATWLSLEKDFRSIANSTVAAQWVSRQGCPREWNVWGDGQRRFTSLAERAGNMLPRTPRSGDFVAADVLAETNALWRWLCLLATDGTTQETTGDGHETDSQGNKVLYEFGGLKDPQERSANMCAEIAAKIV